MRDKKLIKSAEKRWLLDVLSNKKPEWNDALDVEELLEVSIRHGLSAVLYQTIMDDDIACSAALKAGLKKAYFSNFIRNTNISRVWEELTGLLDEQGYQYIPLKGIFLSQYIYSDMTLRAMSDIDVLLYPDDAEDFYVQMLEKGAVSAEPDYIRQETTDHHLPGLTYHHVYIEIHRNILPNDASYLIPLELLWSKAKKINNVVSLEPSLNLIYLCLHLYYTVRQGGVRLSWLYDFIVFSQSDFFKQGEAEFMKVLKELDCAEPVLGLLYVTEKLFDYNFPFIEHGVNSKMIRSIEKRVLYFFNNELERSTVFSYEVAIERLKNTEGLSNKLRFIRQSILKNDSANQSIFKRIVLLNYRMLGMLKQKLISFFRF